MSEHGKESAAAITKEIEYTLAAENLGVEATISEALLGDAISGNNRSIENGAKNLNKK